jgi:hypothetical protein
MPGTCVFRRHGEEYGTALAGWPITWTEVADYLDRTWNCRAGISPPAAR